MELSEQRERPAGRTPADYRAAKTAWLHDNHARRGHGQRTVRRQPWQAVVRWAARLLRGMKR